MNEEERVKNKELINEAKEKKKMKEQRKKKSFFYTGG